MNFLLRIYAKLIYLVGDTHSTNRFPWISWSVKKYQVSYDEILEALPLIKYGDVGLHRDAGYMSNAFIPGFMKHGWIHTWDTPSRPKIVEAISDGVVENNAIKPMLSDYTIILSPKDVTDEERKGACKKAQQVVGVGYDPFFNFDIEEQLVFYTGTDQDGAQREALNWGKNAYNYTFSCTEIVSYAWWHKREELKIKRTKRLWRDTILADDFLNDAWEIKWISRSVTPEVARKLGLHDEGVRMIEQFIAKRDKAQKRNREQKRDKQSKQARPSS